VVRVLFEVGEGHALVQWLEATSRKFAG